MYRKVKRSVCEIIAYICGISGPQKNLRKLFLCLCENKNRVIFISFFFRFFFYLLAFDPSLLNPNFKEFRQGSLLGSTSLYHRVLATTITTTLQTTVLFLYSWNTRWDKNF